jgi:hypothetical protein
MKLQTNVSCLVSVVIPASFVVLSVLITSCEQKTETTSRLQRLWRCGRIFLRTRPRREVTAHMVILFLTRSLLKPRLNATSMFAKYFA